MVDEVVGKLSKDGSPHVTDEKFNTASHLSAAILSLLGTVLLVVQSSVAAKPWHIVSFSIYGLSLFLLFLASTLHHGVEGSRRLVEFFRSFDYYAIFLLIAGTFTPMCLVVARGALGWSVLGVSWAVAIAGIALRAIFPGLPKWVSLTMYATMGWLGAALAWAVFDALSWYGFIALVAGGVLYTGGAFIFISERPNPVPGKFGFHEIWHLFVILGALAHFVMMYVFVLPLP
jgi:hemolysin III